MLIASITQSEIRTTVEAMINLANSVVEREEDLRSVLIDKEFSRVEEASPETLRRLAKRIRELFPLIAELVDHDTAAAIEKTNNAIAVMEINPVITDHDGIGPHIHWTTSASEFDDRVLTDILMSLVHELCDNGTIRFGRCGATNCDRLFYDGTRNRSRRFCDDQRCASRTHTADHRARKKTD